MNKNLFLLASASLLVLAPVSQHQLFGMDPAMDQPMSVTISQDTMKTDEAINNSVKEAFASDKDLANAASDVTVKSDQGVVTLTGTVKSDKLKSDFEAKAKAVSGVTKVVNNLEVKAAAF